MPCLRISSILELSDIKGNVHVNSMSGAGYMSLPRRTIGNVNFGPKLHMPSSSVIFYLRQISL